MTRDRSSILGIAAVVCLAGVLATFTSWVALERWDSFETNAFDLGFFDQILYNTLQLRPGQTTFIPYNFNGQHLEPILAVFLLPYALGAGPPFLMLTQSVVASAAAVPLYGAAHRLTRSPLLAVVVAVAYLLNGYLHRALIFDFHPEVMLGLPAFAAIWALAEGRIRLACILALSCSLFKEDAGLVTAALGAVIAVHSARRPGLLVAAAGLSWLVIAVVVVMPVFRQGAPSDLVERYGYLAGATSQSELLPELARRPWVIFEALAESGRIGTVLLFAAVTAPLAVFRPGYLLLMVPSLLVAVLADHHGQTHLEYHYAIEATILAIVAGALGLRNAQRSLGTPLTALAAVVPAFVGMVVLSPYPEWVGGRDRISPQHHSAVMAALAVIPTDDQASVTAQSGLLPRLSQRDHIYEFPSKALLAEWVIVDRYGQRSAQSIAFGFESRLNAVRDLDERVFEQDGVEVFHKR